MLTFIDFFAGIGGFRRGMELAGHKCIGFCEFDKFAMASYTAMHCMTDEDRERLAALPKNRRVAEAGKEEYRHGEWYANDVRRIFAEDIPKADCWCFGFPCQDISVAGKQTGFRGNRSSLFFRIVRLIQDVEEESRPTYLLIENVKNLLSVNRGWDFLAVLSALDESGYNAEWQVINSAGFVPQNRERVFIIGHFRGRGSGEVFPIQGADGENTILQIGNFMPTKKRDNPNQGRIYDSNGIAPCLNQMGGGGREPYVSLYAFCDLGCGEGTTAQDRHGVMVGLPDGGSAYAVWYEKYGCYTAIRRLTPRECFRLQGWEDIYFERAALVNSDSQLYRQAGNGVTVPVIRAIAERMEI